MSAPSSSTEFSLTLGELTQVSHDKSLEIEIPYNYNLVQPKLMVRKISKSFPVNGGKIQALKDIDLTINTGEFVCLIGPSGCGKSTLLNIIAGLEKQDYGEISSFGIKEKEGWGEHLLIFQEAALFPWLSVFDNVAFGLKLRRIPREQYQDLVEKYLSLVHLSSFKDAYIHQLSGGMKQRVALARALVLEPAVLLMDEPFAALDIQTRKEMYNLLLEIWKETKKTILFITHNVDEALTLSNRVLVMKAHPGEIKNEFRLETGPPRSLEHAIIRQIRAEIIHEFSVNPLCQGGTESERNH